jgi:hypothetical protein
MSLLPLSVRMSDVDTGDMGSMERERMKRSSAFATLDPAVAASRLAEQRRRRDDARLAQTAREMLSEAKRRQRRFDRRTPPVEPMS